MYVEQFLDKNVPHTHDTDLLWIKKYTVDNSYDIYSGADVDADGNLTIPPHDLTIKISKEKKLQTETTSVPTTSNNEDKIKRKRDQVRQTSNSSLIYTEEPSVNTSSKHYSGNNDDHVADTTTSNATPGDATTVDAGAFDLDASVPTVNNN
jgi:hypothetical protein